MKKCPKCGAELPDEAMFCNECGEKLNAPAADPAPAANPAPAASQQPVNPAPAGSYQAPVNNATLAAAQQKAKNNTIGIVAVAAGGLLIVVLLIVLLINLLGGGYKKPINDLIRNLNKGNTDVTAYMPSFYPGFVIDAYNTYDKMLTKADNDDTMEDLHNNGVDKLEDFFDDLRHDYGDNYKITIEWKRAEPLDKDDLEDIQDAIEDSYDWFEEDFEYDDVDVYDDYIDDLDDDYDIKLSDSDVKNLQRANAAYFKAYENCKVQAGYELSVKFTISGKKDDDKTGTLKIIVIKINGDWVIYSWNGSTSSCNLSYAYNYSENAYYLDPLATIGDMISRIRSKIDFF